MSVPITLKNCTLTKVGAIFNPNTPLREWAEDGAALIGIQGKIQFFIGDWINFGAAAYGDKYQGALEKTNYEYQTLRDCAYVCASVQLSRRRDNLSFGHHREVAPFTAEDQEKWLSLASENKWSVSDLRQAIRKSKAIHFDDNDGDPERGFIAVVSEAERMLRQYIQSIPITNWSAEERANTKNMLKPLVEVYEQL